MKRNKKPNLNERKSRFSLTLLFSIIIFVILLVSVALAALTAYIFSRIGLIRIGFSDIPELRPLLLYMTIVSLIIGFGIAVLTLKYPLKPVNRMITQMNRLAVGDFKARLYFGKIMASHPAFREMSESFNKMAMELEGTEMLRSDFINNFSHEFKTPIVSIAGFAKLLKRGNLTEEQKREYIDIIEEESLRLSYMATNVLNLTKVENQTILTEISSFNLSEQIRSCVLLLENKWSGKHLDFVLEFPEYTIYANEELLRQVWINLIDNAVKFTPDYGTVEIKIDESEKLLSVSVINTGSEISPENQKRIFNKFYQADESHASEGNGVGLAIVKKIAFLHGGTVSVKSEHNVTSFKVELPKVK
ncbi:MAG: HAMP domain-containing histidine kinase [Clostridia bacterium]|nr:HAMP domain-containing histidine kinase [Clostridia bacterium]